jgi:hypothetical protein
MFKRYTGAITGFRARSEIGWLVGQNFTFFSSLTLSYFLHLDTNKNKQAEKL